MTYIPLILLFVLIALGVPVFLSMGVAGGIGILMMGGFKAMLGIFNSTAFSSIAHYELLSVPLFMLMANFLTSSKLTNELFGAVQKWVGRVPGGLAMATVISGAGLGALCGSSSGSAATLAGAAAPEMKKHGYSTKLTMGVVSISGTLAIMIPPSGTLIIFGLISEYPITELFKAGILPGILTAVAYCLTIFIWVKRSPDSAPRSDVKVSFKEKMYALKDIWPVLLLLVIVLVSIFSGWVTITESSGIAALGAFLIPLFMGRLSFAQIKEALTSTLRSTAMIFTIIIGATIFGYYLTMTNITTKLVTAITSWAVPGSVIVLGLVVLYAILGFFMDQVAILYLTLPLAVPIVESLGFNMYWFAIMIVAAAETGLVTPPVGLNCYVTSGATGESLETTFSGVMPFVLTEFVVIIILFLFPWLSTCFVG